MNLRRLQSCQRRYDAMQPAYFHEPSSFVCRLCGERRDWPELVWQRGVPTGMCVGCEDEIGFSELCKMMNQL